MQHSGRPVEQAAYGRTVVITDELRDTLSRLTKPLGLCSTCRRREAISICGERVACRPCSEHRGRVEANRRDLEALEALAAADDQHPGALWNIAGYSARWDERFTPSSTGRAERVLRGAFTDAIRGRRVQLRIDHGGPSSTVASMADGTLRLAQDSRGLWFSARLPRTAEGRRLLAAIRQGEIKSVSPGWTGKHVTGYPEQLYTRIDLTEISLLTSTRRPAWPSCWVRDWVEAFVDRDGDGDG